MTITTATITNPESETNAQHLSLPSAQIGDVVTIDLAMTPENGYVPESLFDTQGVVSFVLGWGNYLPGLHELVQGCRPGDSVQNVSVDSGWGSRQQDLLFEVALEKLDKILLQQQHLNPSVNPDAGVQVGQTLKLSKTVEVLVQEIREEPDSVVVLDANPPLAGSSFACSFRVLNVESIDVRLFELQGDEVSNNSRYQMASFGLGCFWGAELAFARLAGVVGTQVGYSQGTSTSPTYEEVCEGTTRHRETVLVVYDSTLVSYEDLILVALERLEQTTSSMELHMLFETPSENFQYKNGFYYHSDEQRLAATKCLAQGNRFGVELLAASKFYQAEAYHQHYLYKGGQSARKGCKDVIRCYG